MPRAAKGFTLMDALIAMGIAAILLVVAVPAWFRATAAAKVGSVRADLTASLLDAIRHATITGSEVVMCPATAAQQCSGSINWDGGWLVFADLNGNRVADSNETRLVSGKPLPGAVHLRTTAGRTRLVFQPNGSNAGSNITFTLCHSRNLDSATTLVLSNSGNFHSGQPTPAVAWNCVYGTD